jgi:hypothetical protein
MDLIFWGAVLLTVWLFLKRRGQNAANRDGGPSPSAPTDVTQPMTSSNALDDIMQAISDFEGGRPGDRNIVNSNPGNLRSASGMIGKAGGFATFADTGDGWDALQSWIQRHVADHPDWDFYDLFNYYLRGKTTGPTVDQQGDSDQYAEYVAGYAGFNPSQTVSSALGA